METLEQIAERVFVSVPQIERLIKDPAFRQLMAAELVKVDMEPAYFIEDTGCNYLCTEIPLFNNQFPVFTQDQLTAAVMKEREECAPTTKSNSPRHTECGNKIAHKIRSWPEMKFTKEQLTAAGNYAAQMMIDEDARTKE